jgi:formyltetrahydrofolate deformylase
MNSWSESAAATSPAGAKARPVTATLLADCPDRPGLVSSISGFIYANGGNILAADQHSEPENGHFFMRVVWDLGGFHLDRPSLALALGDLGRRLSMTWSIQFSDNRQRVAILVSRTPHCLYDLLQSEALDELGGDVVGVISNHDELRSVADHFNRPCVVIRQDREHHVEAEAQMLEVLDGWGTDVVVLARYMQVLSPAFVERWEGRLINVHHSFLPSFVGARAYRQARDRGVKMIGATAHYTTNKLDQGPIIEQDVVRVSHRDTLGDFVRKGRELERGVLTRAVRLHLERRVLVSGTRTIVFG